MGRVAAFQGLGFRVQGLALERRVESEEGDGLWVKSEEGEGLWV